MSKITEDLKEKINIEAYFLSQEDLPYDTLCWMLAERQLYQKIKKKAPKELIKNMAAEIFFSSPPYDVLCWLIAELNILINKGTFDDRSKFFG
ncbi:MAG: hypothetical protein EU540_06285 [Promethearchaeota archaeon]|nr:MAG: hypothetical protein EU540_06285 [Candidatus Lokiarchaeota archaeon]